MQRGRLDEIRQKIKREKQVSVSELSGQYGVTEETIRRDLEKLKDEGLIARTYGGAVLNQKENTENIDYFYRAQTNIEEKRIIGQLAARVIPEKTTIGADASSTVVEAIRAIGDRPDITVLTNSIMMFKNTDQMALSIMSTGGLVNKRTSSMQGLLARKILREYHVDIVLISCKALLLNGGVYDSNEEEAELKKVLIERGQRVILLADHTKFDKVAFVKVIELGNLDTVITDRKPSQDWLELFKKNNTQVLYPQ